MTLRRRPIAALSATALVLLVSSLTALTPGAPVASATGTNPWLTERVLAIAHAGGEDEAPHETRFAYQRAAALGVDVLDGDVRLTADNVLVVHHDSTVDATTNGTGRVDEKTYAELFALDHGYKFTPDHWSCGNCPEADYIYRGIRDGSKPPPAGHVADDFTIPTAEWLFTTFPTKTINLEIKESGEPARKAADALIALVKAQHAEARTVFVSFDDSIVQYVRDQFPEAMTSPGQTGVTTFFLTRAAQPEHKVLQVPPTYSGITVVDAKFVADAHAVGLAVWVWMDSKEQESDAFYQQLLDWGVDGINGSRPQVARTAIDRNGLTWVPPTTTTTTTATTSSTTTTSTTTSSTTTTAPSTGAKAVAAVPAFAG